MSFRPFRAMAPHNYSLTTIDRGHLLPRMSEFGADGEPRCAIDGLSVPHQASRCGPAGGWTCPTRQLPIPVLCIPVPVAMHVMNTGLVALVFEALSDLSPARHRQWHYRA